MFGETTIFYIKIWKHPIETTIYKWLFGVPGRFLWYPRSCLRRSVASGVSFSSPRLRMAEGLRKKAEYATRRPNGFWLEPQTLGILQRTANHLLIGLGDYEFHPIFLSRGENHHAKGSINFENGGWLPGDELINPIVGVYIPIIRIPIKGGMTIPNIRQRLSLATVSQHRG